MKSYHFNFAVAVFILLIGFYMLSLGHIASFVLDVALCALNVYVGVINARQDTSKG
jgi:hypothetical protein